VSVDIRQPRIDAHVFRLRLVHGLTMALDVLSSALFAVLPETARGTVVLVTAVLL
jgi:hypothetical protein